MANSPLKQKAAVGMFWKFIEVGVTQAIGFVISIYLARLLSPDDFGLIGMLAVFIAITNIFIESGFSQALIQKKDRTETDYATVFYFNLLVSLVCYALLYSIAPFVAHFYDKPELVNLLRVLGLNVIILSFNIVQQARLFVDIDFKTNTKVSFAGVLSGGIAGLAAAYLGLGVWALVLQQLVNSLSRTVTMWYSAKWKPLWAFSTDSLKTLFGYGSKLLLSGLYATTLQYIYNIVIGKLYHEKLLGYYTRAYQLPDLISGTVNAVVSSVTFPVMSAIQDERERLLNVYAKMLSMTAFLVFPVMTLFAVLAEPFVRTLLTDKWLPIVPLMYWLAIARMFIPISAINLTLLKSIGRSDLFLKVDLFKLPLIAANMIITLPMGIQAVAIGSSIVTFISYFINAYMPGRLFGYGALQQARDCRYTVLATAIMGLVTFAFISLVSNPWVEFIGGGLIGVATYVGAVLLLKVKEVSDIRTFLTEAYKHHTTHGNSGESQP
jgi:O-antigen/teichoic acid export membrane protein